MRDALIKNNIPFKEQYKVYTGGKFNEVKYVGDFYIKGTKAEIIVECDGITYHSGTYKKRQVERDEWLRSKGYKVIHFTTRQIKYKMQEVISCIVKNMYSKDTFTLSSIIPSEKGKKPFVLYDNNVNVALFCYYKQKNNDVYFTYKFKSITKNVWSDERKAVCFGVPQSLIATTAIYCALLDLKRAVNIKVFFNGILNIEDYELVRKFRFNIRRFENGSKVLENKMYFKYCNIKPYQGFNPHEDIKTMKELKSRCFQISNHEEHLKSIKKYQYDLLIKENNKIQYGFD